MLTSGIWKFIVAYAYISCLLTFSPVGAQDTLNLEEVALRVFLNEIFPKEFPEVKNLGFKGEILNYKSAFSNFKDCFSEKQYYRIEMNRLIPNEGLNNSKSLKKVNLASLNDNIKYKKKSKYRLQIFSFNYFEEQFFVRIDIKRQRHFTVAYIFRMNAQGNIIDWCKSIKWN